MSRTPEKDLFNESTMSFGDHLEELRSCLFHSVIAIICGFLIGLYYANEVVIFIQGPLTTALKEYYLDLEKEEIKAEYGEDAVERLVLIEEQGLIVDTMQIDLDALVINLQQSYQAPGPLMVYLPYSFMQDDFKQGPPPDVTPLGVNGIFSQLVEQPENADSPHAYLAALLGDDMDLVSRLAMVTAEEYQQDRQLRKASVDLLNRWVADRELAGSGAFAEVGISHPLITNLRAQLKDPGSVEKNFSARRLNRLLINEVFQDYLRPAQPQLLDVPLWKPIEIRVQTLNAQEAFMIWLKAAFICGFLIASPIVFYKIWSFVAAGLYTHEKKYVGIYLPLSLGLFLGGASLAFFFVFEPVLDFLFSFNRAMNIHPDPRISEWLGFVLFLPIGFGIAFQLPLVMLLLHRIGIMSVQTFLDKWRIAVLVIAILSMLLTPADPISMLLLAVPLVVLYFLGILLAIWMPRIENPYPEGYDPS